MEVGSTCNWATIRVYVQDGGVVGWALGSMQLGNYTRVCAGWSAGGVGSTSNCATIHVYAQDGGGVGVGSSTQTHTVATLSLPRKKLKLVTSSTR